MGVVLRILRFLALVLFMGTGLAVVIPLVFLFIRSIEDVEGIPPDLPGDIRNVHALGINPKDGTLYAATLRGLYRIAPDNRGWRLADSYQENKGFLVLGPDRFLASGRPDFRDLLSDFEPEHQGVLHSTNAGRSWSSIALKGKASFSCLEAQHGLIYGYDIVSESFMVSRNEGHNWQTVSDSPPPLEDVEVSPADPNAMLGTVEGGGVFRSSDAGVTWRPLPDISLVQIEWLQADQLWGIGAEGQLYFSSDAGANWERRGDTPGTPDAFLVTNDALYTSIYLTGIYVSFDGGQTWEARYTLPQPG
jgi:hypothetical protein